MNDYADSPKYSIPQHDHSDLEAVPLSHLEPAYQQPWSYSPQQNPPVNPALNAPHKEFYGAPSPGGSWAELPLRPGPAAEPRERILGLSVKRFWIILIVLVVIIAIAIGAGVGVGMAARSQADSTSPAASNQAGSGQETNTSSAPSGLASDTPDTSESDAPGPSTSETAKATDKATPTTTTLKAGVSPIPTDGGCPNIDDTDFTPKDGQGKEIPLGSGGELQTFVRHCETNWPAGGDYGNPRVHDIMKFYLPSLEECITACASYNRNYVENIARGIGHYEGGLCRAVTVVKTPGEYCYLKNNTGKMDTMGNPKKYSSAVLVMESDGD